jgi:hypothetical protein
MCRNSSFRIKIHRLHLVIMCLLNFVLVIIGYLVLISDFAPIFNLTLFFFIL